MIKSFDVPVKWHEFSYVNKCHKKSNYTHTGTIRVASTL